jgi:hypothetical protein
MKKINFDLRFHCQVSAKSEYFGVLGYYQNIMGRDGGRSKVRDLILESASYFWRPLIRMGSDRREAIDLATVCVHKIQRKIEELEGLKSELESSRGERVLKDVPKEDELIFAIVSRITGNHQGAIELARYLRGDEHFSPFEKILWSSDAFHGVTAYRELGIYDDGRVREKAEYCIGELERQIGLFYRLFPDVETVPALPERKLVTGGNRSPRLGNADDAEWSEMAAIGDGLL